MATTLPTTPQKSKILNDLIAKWTLQLSQLWDIALPIGQKYISPRKRQEGIRSEEDGCVDKIMFNIRFICCKQEGRMKGVLERYQKEGRAYYSGWVKKPIAERGLLPEKTRQCPRPITQDERRFLQNLLRDLLQQVRSELQRASSASPLDKPLERSNIAPNLNLATSFQSTTSIVDDPIDFRLSSGRRSDTKRPLEESPDVSRNKKARIPLTTSTSEPNTKSTMPPPDRGGSRTNSGRKRPHVEISFDSETDNSSVFDKSMSATLSFNKRSRDYLTNTQETIPDEADSFEKPEVSQTSQEPQSSEYFGSSFDVKAVTDATRPPDESLSQNLNEYSIKDRPMTKLDFAKDRLEQSLSKVFPEIPRWLKQFPLAHRYEITRVFLYTSTPLPEVGFVFKRRFENYNTFWSFLKTYAPLEGRSFPVRSSHEAWVAAVGDYHQGFRGVLLSGALQFSPPSRSNSLFQLQLNPLRLESSHRLARKYGSHRFLEIDLPDLSDRKVPRLLSDLGDAGIPSIARWLVNHAHTLFGRRWSPFLVKHLDRKDRKSDDTEVPFLNRVYFFATKPDLTISQLLNAIRPIRKNAWQSYLKLFARSSLAVSRNSETITLDRDQIIDKDDIEIRYNVQTGTGTIETISEVMTDGAGRISLALAQIAVTKLGYSYLPSGFQARIGEAKGFWQVDHYDRIGKVWIEIYKSQRKWNRSTCPNGESDDVSHRTFEVLRCSGPLKSADLNTQFLPLLVSRAKDPRAMRDNIARILREGLSREIEGLGEAMKYPQSLRKWLRDASPNLRERKRDGIVAHRAGLPARTEEILNFLLDAGFDPRQQVFLHDRAWTLIKGECETLQRRMNITVDKSTYAFMVPDFFGVLEPDEVYLDFSGFVEETSGFAGEPLSGLDILVARAPAHFPSDIQRVKAVSKVELMGLKDVIVFPTRGHPSLAAKLSGGDYDGDIAWICWDQSIVQNFTNADMPKAHDLVAEGHMQKESTSYEDLVAGRADKVPHFLTKSFEFNLQPSLLGICTVFKEKLCYTQKSVDTPEAILLSTLLSNLVDQTKQGYIFTQEDWTRIKNNLIKTKPVEPMYKQGNIVRNAENILDHLAFVADETVKEALEKLNASLMPKPSSWDEDLVRCYNEANTHPEPEWKTLIKDLKTDLTAIRNEWETRFRREGPDNSQNDDMRPGFVAYLLETYERYKAILPHTSNPLTQALLLSPSGVESSTWAQLRASTLFALYSKSYVANFVWWMAGRQLAIMKAAAASTGGIVPSVGHMSVILKPDASFVRQVVSEIGAEPAPPAAVWDSMSVSNADDIE